MNLKTSSRDAFTLVEIMVVVAIFSGVMIVALSIHLWAARMALDMEGKSWAQLKSLFVSSKITSVVQNASGIHAIDTTNGRWVDLTYPGGQKARLAFTPGTSTTTGTLSYTIEGQAPEVIAPEGIDTYAKTAGAARPVFSRIYAYSTNESPNSILIQFMVAKPAKNGGPAADTQDALNISLTASMRNYVEP